MLKKAYRTPISVAIAVSLTVMGDSLLYAVLPTQAAALGIPLASVGILLSVNRFVRLFTNEWAGRVFGRGERERPFFLATLGATVSTWMYILPWGFWPFLVSRALWGTSWSFLRLGNYLSVLERTEPTERGRWLGQVKAINRVATMLATAMGGYLTDKLGYHFAVGMFGTLTAIGTVIAYKELARARKLRTSNDAEPSGVDKSSRDVSGTVTKASAPSHTPLGHTPAKLRSRLLVTYFGSFTHGLITHGLVTGTIALLLMERYGEQVGIFGFTIGVATLSGLVLAVRWFADIFIAPLGGSLTDRISRRRIAVVTAVLQGLSLVALAFATHPVVTILATWAVFIVAMVFALSLESIAAEIGTQGDASHIMGRFSTVQDIGSALGPSLGFSLGMTLGLKTLYLAAAAIVALVGILFWRETVSGRRGRQPLTAAQ